MSRQSQGDPLPQDLTSGRRALAVYVSGGLTFVVDLWVPLDVDISIIYSVAIGMCGWLRLRRHLWFATALFISFVFLDLVIGRGPLHPHNPWWLYLANRSFVACGLLVLASMVHLSNRSMDDVERYGALLAQQNQQLHDVRTGLEQRVQERTRALEIASQQRQEAQAALYQAQKMEAVGQLTGGVAHDFNNLLTIIGGNASILRECAPNERMSWRLDAILRAAERGARLTRQLLAFSRRQPLNPELLDLSERIRDTFEIMERSLRENVQVVLDIANDLWPVEVDAAEFELAIVNIGINARDAMPEGGVLSVTGRNIAFAPGEDQRHGLVGDYVAITLSDTGVGVEPGTLERVFEPFFTTKEVGKGSGLGLSQVYGFAQQSGGAAEIRSEPGHGAAVTLYLPRAKQAPARPAPATPAAAGELTGKILYVEDNNAVAAVTEDMLTALGLDVVRLADASTALTLLAKQSFDLLISDIVMPGMSGIELAREVRRRFPGLPVLLASGYSEGMPDADQAGVVILGKPYTTAALAAAIAGCLSPRRFGGS